MQHWLRGGWAKHLGRPSPCNPPAALLRPALHILHVILQADVAQQQIVPDNVSRPEIAHTKPSCTGTYFQPSKPAPPPHAPSSEKAQAVAVQLPDGRFAEKVRRGLICEFSAGPEAVYTGRRFQNAVQHLLQPFAALHGGVAPKLQASCRGLPDIMFVPLPFGNQEPSRQSTRAGRGGSKHSGPGSRTCAIHTCGRSLPPGP